MAQQRTLDELIDDDEPFLPLLREWVDASERPVEILDFDEEAGARTLLALQVTTRSALGTLAYSTGGLLVDNGWLRIMGSGSERLPRSIARWNGIAGQGSARLPGACLIADDAVGGFFAVNGGGLAGPAGNVFFLAPDTCEWEDLGMGHTEWLHWTVAGDVDGFYESLRWDGWQREVAELGGDRALAIYPLLWMQGGPIEERSRKPVPIEELWGLHAVEFPSQLQRSEE